jgi:hypothetical protein
MQTLESLLEKLEMLQNKHNGASKHCTHYIGDFREIKDVIMRGQ